MKGRTKHNQFLPKFVSPQHMERTWKKSAHFFQVSIHFHPGHLQSNSMIDGYNTVINY